MAARFKAWKILNGEIIKFSPVLSLFILLNNFDWKLQFKELINMDNKNKKSIVFIFLLYKIMKSKY